MIIGLLGTIGSGKTTAASYLVDNYQFTEEMFADPLKKACKEMFLLSDDQLYGTQEQKQEADERWFGASPRQILQFVGTELFRDRLCELMPELGKHIFIHNMRLRLDSIKGNMVVSDVRFQNEIDMIKEMGGYVIRIVRNDSSVCLESGMHASENHDSLVGYDIMLINDGSLEDYYEKLDAALSVLEP